LGGVIQNHFKNARIVCLQNHSTEARHTINFFDISFWQGFVGNLFATIIGVALGIPIDFCINRRVEAATEKEKKYKILSVLLDDLKWNNNQLRAWNGSRLWIGDEPIQERFEYYLNMAMFGMSLSDEKWMAFAIASL
jgi:hypothetical protein